MKEILGLPHIAYNVWVIRLLFGGLMNCLSTHDQLASISEKELVALLSHLYHVVFC